MRHSGWKRLRAWRFLLLRSAFVGGFGSLPLGGQETHPTATPVSSPDVRREAQTLIKKSYHYDATIRQKALEQQAAAPEGVVQLEAVIVAESRGNATLSHRLEQQRRNVEAEKPSLAHGVKIPGLPTDVGITPFNDFMPFGTPIARWSIIHLRF